MRSGTHAEVLVGRSDEVSRLHSLVENVIAGRGQSVLVEGEPGIGKSALLATGLADARRRSCRVLWAVADELSRPFPLRVLLECLETDQEAEVTALSPGGDVWVAVTGDPVLVSVERLLALVDRLCSESPVLMVLDDLQWADESSLLVWHRLSRLVDQLPLLLVAASRPMPRRPEVEQLRRALIARDAPVLSLGPLSSAEAVELAASLVGGLPEAKLRRLAETAGGNPLYLRELVDQVSRERPDHAEAVVDETAMSASLSEAIAARVGSLSPDTGQVLRMAALLGTEFVVMDLATVTGRQPIELVEVIEEARVAGVLVESGSLLVFRHPLIRQALYEAVPAGLRSALHRQVAQAIADAGAPVNRVAEQIVAAEDVTDSWVLDWVTSARQELAKRAPSIAAGLLWRAVDGIGDDDPRREPLEAQLVVVLRLLARYDDVERLASEVLARSHNREHRARITWSLAFTLTYTGRTDEALGATDRALHDAEPDDPGNARLTALRAFLLEQVGRSEEGRTVAERALAEGEQNEDHRAMALALLALAFSTLATDTVAALAFLDRGLALPSGDAESIDRRLVLLGNRMSALMRLDRWADTETTLREALALAEKTGTPRMSSLRSLAAAHLWFTGRWDDAVTELESLLSGDELLEATLLPIRTHGLRALIAAHQDDHLTLAEHLNAARDLPITPGVARDTAVYLLMARALAEERDGRPDQALALLTPMLEPEYAADMSTRDLFLPGLVRLALATGQQVVARAATESCIAEAVEQRLPGINAAAARCRSLQEADPALALEAADHLRRVGRVFELAETLEDAAVLLAERGDLDTARSAVTEAVEIYESLGAAWTIRRADARVRPHGVRRGQRGRRRRPATGWDALTPTELKIAQLVAQGCSNPDIAAQLVISRRTVHTHVSNILAKLGARSRTEIAREVFERQHNIG